MVQRAIKSSPQVENSLSFAETKSETKSDLPKSERKKKRKKAHSQSFVLRK